MRKNELLLKEKILRQHQFLGSYAAENRAKAGRLLGDGCGVGWIVLAHATQADPTLSCLPALGWGWCGLKAKLGTKCHHRIIPHDGGGSPRWGEEPGEGRSKKEKEYTPAIGDTGKGIVPRQEGCEHAKAATSLGELVGCLHGAVVAGVVAAGEHEEGQIQGEEEHEEHDGRAQRAQQQDGGEDEPACQEEAEHRVRHLGIDGLGRLGLVWPAGADNVPVGGEHDAVGDPEAAVGRESGGTEGVADGHFPKSVLSDGSPDACAGNVW